MSTMSRMRTLESEAKDKEKRQLPKKLPLIANLARTPVTGLFTPITRVQIPSGTPKISDS
jgi:hypothetical protein